MKFTAIVLSAVFAVIVTASCTANTGNFSLVNKAKEPIAHASVTVCGQTIEMKGIQPTKSAQGSYKVKSDSHYDVKVEFQSGKKLQKEVGYVTNGLDFQHEITVTDTDIEITDNKVKGR